ncbi:MAG: CHAT domain-containing protein [Candidatus Eisenbacteria sp.]|nr:CHAT domain-containing protein [Candidatus Eisenbacteria bacterium]
MAGGGRRRLSSIRSGYAAAMAIVAVVGLATLVSPSDSAPLSDEQRRVIARIDSLRAMSQPALAHTVIDSLLPHARATNDSTYLADLLLRKGVVWVTVGQPRPATPVLQEAVGISTALRDSARLCAAVRWTAVALGDLGHNEESRAQYQRLLDLADAIGDRRHQGWARIGLAWHAGRVAEFEAATREYRLAAELLQEAGDLNGLIWARNGLGTMLGELGDHEGAQACYLETARVAHENNLRQVAAYALNNLGTIHYIYGSAEQAMVCFQQSFDLHQEIGSLREAITPANNIVYCQIQLGRLEEAAQTLLDLLDECRQKDHQPLFATLLNNLARVRVRQGRPHEAAALFRQTLARGKTVSFKHQLEALTGLAATLAEVDSTEAALAALEARGDIAGQLTGEFIVQWHDELGHRLADAGRWHEALHHLLLAATEAERIGTVGYRVGALARAGEVYRELDMPDSGVAVLTRAAEVWESERITTRDPEWRELWGEAGRAVYTSLADLLLHSSPGKTGAGNESTIFDRLQIFKARTLLERMSGPITKRALSTTDSSITLSRLATLQQTVLEPGELFLDAYLGPQVSILFAVTPAEARVLRLPAQEELERRLRGYHQAISTPPHSVSSQVGAAGRREAGRNLSDLLLGEVADLLAGARRVIVAPDGALNLLPFQALPAPGTTSDLQGEAPAVRSWTRVPSATILAKIRRTSERRETHRASDVHSGTASATNVLVVAGRPDESVEALPGAEAEARRLGQLYRNVDVCLLPATRMAPELADLPRYDVLHFASHVRVDDQYPWRSRILLGSGGDTDRFTAENIADLRLPGRLVILASCQSAAGRIVSGEGILGLSSAFLGAGIPVVVATLWPVDDQATRRLMDHFYAELAGGICVARALVRAQHALRKDPATQHPFFWSGFVVIGDGAVCVPLTRRSTLPPAALTALTALAVLVACSLIILAIRLHHRRARRLVRP